MDPNERRRYLADDDVVTDGKAQLAIGLSVEGMDNLEEMRPTSAEDKVRAGGQRAICDLRLASWKRNQLRRL